MWATVNGINKKLVINMLETHTGENSEILRVTRCDYHEDAVNGNAPDISINLVSEFSQ